VDKGRDGERTPMQWNDSTNAGFSQAKPWLPVPPSYKTHNVATESKQPDSVLEFYKQVLKLRHTSPALLDGKYIALNQDDPNVLSYLRNYKDHTVLVALNFSSEPQKVAFDLKPQGISSGTAKTLVTTSSKPAQVNLGEIILEPFGVYIGQVGK
jgi:alpha-glucosidase